MSTVTLNAYQTKYDGTQGQDLSSMPQDELARRLWITSHDYQGDADHVLVGHAEVFVTLLPRAEVVATQVASLRKQIDDEKLASGVKVLNLERHINSLLAIENAA